MNSTNKKRELKFPNWADILIIIILSLLAATFLSNYLLPITTSGDDCARFYAAYLVEQDKNLNIINPLNEKYNTYVFSSYVEVFKSTFESYPVSSVGDLLLYPPIMKIFGIRAFFDMNILFSILILIAIYLIVFKLFKSRVYGLLASIILFSSPIFLKWSVSYYTSIITLTFFLLSFLFLIANDHIKNRFFSGFFLACILLFRPYDVFLLIPFIFFLYLKKSSHKEYIIFLTPFVFIGIMILSINYIFYKDAFFIPTFYYYNYPDYQTFYQRPTLLLNIHNLINYLAAKGTSGGWYTIWQNLLYHCFFFLRSKFAFPFLYFSIFGFVLYVKERRDVSIFVFILFLVLLFIYGKETHYYGYGIKTLHSSFLRYMLYIYALLPIGFVYLTKKMLLWKKWVIPIIGIVIIITSLPFATFYDNYGLEDYSNSRQHVSYYRNAFSNIIEPASVVITDEYTGKLISPNINPDIKDVIHYPKIPREIREAELKRVISLCLKDGRKVYLAFDKRKSDKRLEILEKDFYLKKVTSDSYYVVYKINLNSDNIRSSSSLPSPRKLLFNNS